MCPDSDVISCSKNAHKVFWIRNMRLLGSHKELGNWYARLVADNPWWAWSNDYFILSLWGFREQRLFLVQMSSNKENCWQVDFVTKVQFTTIMKSIH